MAQPAAASNRTTKEWQWQQKRRWRSHGRAVVEANADAIANAVRTEGVCLVERVMDAEAVAALHQRVASIKP